MKRPPREVTWRTRLERLVERAAADRAAGVRAHRASAGASGVPVVAADSCRPLAEPGRIPRPLPRRPRLAPAALHPAGVAGGRLDDRHPDGRQRARSHGRAFHPRVGGAVRGAAGLPRAGRSAGGFHRQQARADAGAGALPQPVGRALRPRRLAAAATESGGAGPDARLGRRDSLLSDLSLRDVLGRGDRQAARRLAGGGRALEPFARQLPDDDLLAAGARGSGMGVAGVAVPVADLRDRRAALVRAPLDAPVRGARRASACTRSSA